MKIAMFPKLGSRCLLACFLFAVTTTVGSAQVLFSSSSPTAPTPGPNDISNIVATTGLDGSYSSTAYTDNNGRTGTGQTFTLGGTSLTLSSISIMAGGSDANTGSPRRGILRSTKSAREICSPR